ncbi:MAG: MFS transporter [Myxococcota bacterium]
MFHGWWIVLTVFTVQLCMVGFMSYGYGLLLVPVEAEFQCGMERMNAGAIAMSLMGMILPLAVGQLVDRWSVRGLMLIGVAALVAGLVALSLATDWLVWAIVMAVLIAAAMTLLGPIVGQAAVARWFTAARGRALGIAALGTSVGGILMANLFAVGFESIGWRSSLRVMALGVAVVGFPLLVFLFRDHPRDLGLRPDGASGPVAVDSATPLQLVPARTFLRQVPFWAVSISLAIFLGIYNVMLHNVPMFAHEQGADANARSMMMVIICVSGIVGKLAFGWLADSLPLRLGLWIAIGLTATSLAIMTTEPELPLLWASVAVMGLAAGGILPVWGALMAQLFGVANFGRAMGLQAPLIALGAASALWVAGRLHDRTGGFVFPFQIFIVLLGFSALVLLLLRVPARAERAIATA